MELIKELDVWAVLCKGAEEVKHNSFFWPRHLLIYGENCPF